MKTIFLHGLGQNAHDWDRVTALIPKGDFECPSLFPTSGNPCTYSELLSSLTKQFAEEQEPFCICGISLGAVLALDYTIQHSDHVASLVLIACQYKVPNWLVDLQNIMFRCIPESGFRDIGLSKSDTIEFASSMRNLDFSNRLKAVTCPTAVVCGEKDRANRQASRRLNALLPQSELVWVSGVGHEVNQYAPEAITEVLNRYERYRSI